MGSAVAGKIALLKVGAVTIANARTNSLTINNNPIDVSNKSHNNWSATISGVASMTINLDVVFQGETWDETLRGYAIAGSSNAFTMVLGDGGQFTGNFVITSFTVNASYNDAEVYSITLANNGTVTYTAAV